MPRLRPREFHRRVQGRPRDYLSVGQSSRSSSSSGSNNGSGEYAGYWIVMSVGSSGGSGDLCPLLIIDPRH